MPRLKTTVSIDEACFKQACRMLGLTSTSEVVDIALERLVDSQRLLEDIRAYTGRPPTLEETSLGDLPVQLDLDDDDIDYDALYGAS